MWAAGNGYTDIAIALLKAKANVNATASVSVCVAGWMDGWLCVCAEVEHPLGLSEVESRWRCQGRVVAVSAIGSLLEILRNPYVFLIGPQK